MSLKVRVILSPTPARMLQTQVSSPCDNNFGFCRMLCSRQTFSPHQDLVQQVSVVTYLAKLVYTDVVAGPDGATLVCQADVANCKREESNLQFYWNVASMKIL